MFVGSCPNRHRRIRHGVYDNIDAPGGASDDQGVQRRRLATELGMPELRTDKVVMTAMTHPLRTRERPLTIYNSPCGDPPGILPPALLVNGLRNHFPRRVLLRLRRRRRAIGSRAVSAPRWTAAHAACAFRDGMITAGSGRVQMQRSDRVRSPRRGPRA